MKPNSLLLWLGVYIVGVITSYIITKLIDRCDEKVNGYHTKDATEEHETGLVIVFSWIGILTVIIVAVAGIMKYLIDKYIFKENEDE